MGGKGKEYMEETEKERAGWKQRKGANLTEETNKGRTSKERYKGVVNEGTEVWIDKATWRERSVI